MWVFARVSEILKIGDREGENNKRGALWHLLVHCSVCIFLSPTSSRAPWASSPVLFLTQNHNDVKPLGSLTHGLNKCLMQNTCGHVTVWGVWPCDPLCECYTVTRMLILLTFILLICFVCTLYSPTYMGEYNVHTHIGCVWDHICTELLVGRLTGQCELLLCLGGSSSPAPLSSSKLRLRLKAAASCWAPPERLLGSPWCTLLPCSLTGRLSSWSRVWLSAWRCSITWKILHSSIFQINKSFGLGFRTQS